MKEPGRETADDVTKETSKNVSRRTSAGKKAPSARTEKKKAVKSLSAGRKREDSEYNVR